MVRPLGLLRIFVIAFISIVITSISLAQRNITPGLPWTYVTPDSLPIGAIDTAFERTIFNIDSLRSPVRWAYRVNCHLELTQLTDSNTFFIEVPRDPNAFGLTERTEIVEMLGGSLDTSTTSNWIFRYLAGFNSASHPEYSFPEINFEQHTRLDVNGNPLFNKYFASLARIPGLNFIIENPADTVYRSYAYFLQYVDSVWHPRISSILTPKDASTFKTFPNPTTSQFSIELPADWEPQREGYMLRIYDPTAKLVRVRRIWYTSQLHDLALPPNGPPGLYTLTLHGEQGELAVGRVMKSE